MIKKTNTSVLTSKEIAFLKTYINTPSPVGAEYTGQKVWLNYVKPYADQVYTDPYGTGVALINPSKPFKVVLEAHVDEISWFVNYIASDGLIYVKRNGGTDAQIAPGMRVYIHAKQHIVKGVFGWPAIHTRGVGKEGDPQTKVENLFVDCGARTKDEVLKLGIHVGSVITYQDGFDELAHKNYIGRAFDNRIGGFMIAQVLRLLHEKKIKLPYSLFVVNAVQEEIGLAGALMIARRIKPNVAIVTDVTHDTTTPHINQKVEGELVCGKGPSLTYGPAVHNKLNDLAMRVAEKEKIPFQLHAVSRSTGTDTDSFAYANDGCPSVLVSIPLRYMHTTVEMVHHDDIENTIRLMYAMLLELNPDTNLSYFSK